MHQTVGQVAIGGEDDEALAVFVEAAGAKKAVARKLGREEVEDGGGVVWIVVGANEAAGFMHGNGEAGRLRGADFGAFNGDLIDAGGDLLPDGGADAVDVNFAGRDEGFGGAA